MESGFDTVHYILTRRIQDQDHAEIILELHISVILFGIIPVYIFHFYQKLPLEF